MGELIKKVGDVGSIRDAINAISIDDHKMSVNEQIEFYIKNKMPFMLHGISGVGKSRRIKDIDPNFVSIYLRNGMVPEEVIGKTIYPNNDTTQVGKWVAPSWYGDLCEKCEKEKDKVHVLFIDELTNAKETVQSLAYHLVLDHAIAPNMGKLPDNCVVVCAGNSRDESAAANIIPEPLFRRFVAHIYLEPNIIDWLEWGQVIDESTGHDRIHPVVRAFLSYNKKLFCSEYDPEDPPKYAVDPRAWEQVSDVIYANGGKIVTEIIENKIGQDNTKKFINFAKQYVPITVTDILKGNYDIHNLPVKADQIYAFVLTLTNATNEQVGGIRDFIKEQFGNEFLSKYDLVWIGDNPERALVIDALQKQKNKVVVADKQDSSATESSQNNSNHNFEITIEDFVKKDPRIDPNSSVTDYIQCDNSEQAIILERVFDEVGHKLSIGTKFSQWSPCKNSKSKGQIWYSSDGKFTVTCPHTIGQNHGEIYYVSDVDMTKYLTDEEKVKIYGESFESNSNTCAPQAVATSATGNCSKYTLDEFLSSQEPLILYIDINSYDNLAKIFNEKVGGRPLGSEEIRLNEDINHFFVCTSGYHKAICTSREIEIEDINFSKYLDKKELDILYGENLPTTYKVTLDEILDSGNQTVLIKEWDSLSSSLVSKAIEASGKDNGNVTVRELPEYLRTKILGVEDVDMSSYPELKDAYDEYMANNKYINKPIDYHAIYNNSGAYAQPAQNNTQSQNQTSDNKSNDLLDKFRKIFTTTIDECLDENSSKPYRIIVHNSAQYRVLAKVLNSRGATRHNGSKYTKTNPMGGECKINVREGTLYYNLPSDNSVDITDVDMIKDLTLDEIRTVYGDDKYQDIKSIIDASSKSM